MWHRARQVGTRNACAASQRSRGDETGPLQLRWLAEVGRRSGGLRGGLILLVNSGSCGEAKFKACQVAGSLPVQRGAVPVGLQAEEVERGGHVNVVEAGFGQASVAGAAGAVAGGLVHGALDAGPAGVIGLERDGVLRGSGGGL